MLFQNTIKHVYDACKDYVWKHIPRRKGKWLEQDVFNKYQSETNMMRYINELVSKDFSLVNGMIPLSSCTMKLESIRVDASFLARVCKYSSIYS